MSLSPELVQGFLETHLGAAVSDLELLRGGDWSTAFGFRCRERDLVARFGMHIHDFESDRRAMSFSCSDLPVPEVLDIGEGLGGYFCISLRVFGEMLDGLDAAKMRRVVPAVLRAMDAMRLVDLGEWPHSNATWAEQLLSVDEETDRVFGWHDKMASSPMGDRVYRDGLAFLRDHISACPDIKHLVHNDMLHFNVLVRDDAITGVIDWGTAIVGDFLYELATFTLYTPWYPAMQDIDWMGEVRRHYREVGLEVPGFEIRLRCYELHLALSGLAYSAFRENWKDFADVAAQVQKRLAT